jgi:Ala-tRNA(Pro) deacylase
MPVKKVKEFLEENHIKYVSVAHSTAYTAQEIAASAHIPGKEMAKTVMVKIDGRMAMAVLPANYQIDFSKLKKLAGSQDVELASEEEFKYMFPDCEIGAMPPFGNLYDMPVFVAESLAEDEEIDFNAGTHREIIKIKYKDFEKLVKPKVGKFSLRK